MVSDDKVLFMEDNPLEGAIIDIDTPVLKTAKPSLPDEISTMSDIKNLEDYVAINYTKGIRLYRGHESSDYKLESTIVRHVKKNYKELSVKDVLNAEKKGYDMFCREIFKKDWLQNKPHKTDETLFTMSIARHLGLPCRLIDVTASLETAIWFAVKNPQFYNVDGDVILIILDKNNVSDASQSSFNANKLSYAHEPFITDAINELPLGEQRRFIQNGHFIWVSDSSLLNEEQVISNSAFYVKRFKIPRWAKRPLAIELCRELYCSCMYQSEIEDIKQRM